MRESFTPCACATLSQLVSYRLVCTFLSSGLAPDLAPTLSVPLSSDLLQAVVPRMAARDPDMRSNCCFAVKELLRSDVEGAIALEAVQLVADLVKKRG